VQPRGSVNPVSVLMLLGLAGGLYWAVLFVPMYLDNMSMSEVLDVGISAAGGSDNDVVNSMLNRANLSADAIGSHLEENDNGEVVETKGLGLTADNITVTRDERRIKVAIDYTRTVRLKPTQKVRVLTFHVEKEGPISK
jgi:hypothetical protein